MQQFKWPTVYCARVTLLVWMAWLLLRTCDVHLMISCMLLCGRFFGASIVYTLKFVMATRTAAKLDTTVAIDVDKAISDALGMLK